jgi:hypothetical protein
MKINILLSLIALSSLALLAYRWHIWRNEWVRVELPYTIRAAQEFTLQRVQEFRVSPDGNSGGTLDRDAIYVRRKDRFHDRYLTTPTSR